MNNYYTYGNSSNSTFYYSTNGYINITTTTIVTANNLHMYKTFIATTEFYLEVYIYENITKESLDKYGKEYAYDIIENEFDNIIRLVVLVKEQKGFKVKNEDYADVVKEIRDSVNLEVLYNMIDAIYES